MLTTAMELTPMLATVILSRPSRNFPDHLESFQITWKVSISTGKSKKFQKILCILACLLMVDFIDTRKNCPDAQKLSGWQCCHETWVFCLCAAPPQLWLVTILEPPKLTVLRPGKPLCNTSAVKMEFCQIEF